MSQKRMPARHLSCNQWLTWLSVACLALAGSGLSFAGTFTAFGPQDYKRDAGAPVTVSNSFSVLNPNTQYTLKAFNGGLQDNQAELVSSSVVTLNGVQVLGPSNFNQNVSEIDVPVTLQASNTLAVQVRGQPGGVLTIEIIGVDNDPPVITASANPAADSFGWNNTNVVVTFTCSDKTSGVASCPAPVTVNTEGANQVISGTATDKAGNTASISVTINLDKTPPTVTAISAPPADGFGWNNTSVTVTFNCADALSGVANCSAPVSLNAEEANQPVTGTATDKAGNTASATATINIDETPPTITAQATPVPNAAGWNNTNVNVAFTCSDNLSGVALCPPPTLVSSEDANEKISGTAADRAGNTASASVNLNIDKTSPTVTSNISPQPNAAGWNNTDVTVTFQCSDSLSGVATCAGSQSVSSEGANQIVNGAATDVAGNSASATATINLDKTPPVINITSPTNNSFSSTSTLQIAGTATDALSGVATTTCNGSAGVFQGSSFNCSVSLGPGANAITVIATDVAGNSSSQSLTVNLGPAITDFNPKSASVGTLITVSGSGFTSGVPQVVLTSQNGGTIAAPVANFTSTSLSFVIPDGAASGVLAITVGTQTVTSAATLTIVPSSGFSLTVGPASANLIQGQQVNFAVTLSSSNGFNQLAALIVTGVPAGVTTQFVPPQITAGQTSLLTLSAPAGQAVGPATLKVTASATVNGIAVSQSATALLNIQPVATAFMGRAGVDDALQTPLAGVVVTFLGQDGMGGTTTCSGQTQSDEAGNFSFTGLPDSCVGEQLIRYDGSSATTAKDRAAGTPVQYAGVDLLYNIVSHQVTTPPTVIRLPRIDNKETVLVAQNSSQDQTFAFKTIPNLNVTVYAGTTFSLADGSHPDPFPLIAVDVPVDRLPDEMPNSGSTINAFIVAFQPANAVASQPVAVNFPNTLNTPPGTNMELDTLNPTIGMMVKYGTGTVSNDGTQIVPDFDPAHPNHRFGLVHFDWHGPQTQPPNQSNPGPPDGDDGGGNPANGGGPGNGDPGNDPPDPDSQPCDSCPCTTNTSSLFDGVTGHSDRITDHSDNGEDAGLRTIDVGSAAQAGDPVDLFSGIQVIKATDISISGPRGRIAIVRTYRSLTNNAGPFGIGTNHNYGHQLNIFPLQQGQGLITLVMPDGNQFPFNRQADGTFTNTSIPAFRGAVLTASSGSQFNLRWKNGTVYQFQAIARLAVLTAIVGANGNTIFITQDFNNPGRVTQVTDPVGRSLTLAYDGSGRVTTITDPIGRSVQYTYNAQGTLASVINPAGGVTQYGYDSQNRLLTITDPRGILQAQNTLDANGRVIQQVRPNGSTLTFTYANLNPDAPNSPIMFTHVTDNLGVSAGYRFNPQGFVTDIVATGGQMRSIERASGTNQVLSVTEATSRAAFTYDANGNLLTSTDALGNTTTFTYESVFNKVTSVTDALGSVTQFTYDSHGNLLTRTDANGHTTSFAYSPFGQVTQITDPLGNKTTLSYDNFGNLTSTTDPLGNTTSTIYDGISRPVQMIDALGRKNQTAYNALDQVTKRTNAQGGVTQFAYDPDRNLLSLTDANGHMTSFTYDSMNHLSTKTDPLGKTDTRTYDINGNLIQFVDRRGQTSKFLYDNLNRLVESDYQDSTVTRSYDALGRLVHVNDSASGEFDFAYDPAGRLLTSVNPVGTVQYTYDADGRLTLRQVAGQPALQYSYDPAGNLLSASLPQASASFAYDARNQLTKIDRANGVGSRYQYDPAGRLLSLVHAGPAGILNTQSYAYDVVGNRISYSANITQPLTTQSMRSQYDGGNRLIQSSSQTGSTAYSYDNNGNLVLTNGAASSTAIFWDSRGRLQSISESNGQTTTLAYDFKGNLISQKNLGPASNLGREFLLDDLTNIAYLRQSDGDGLLILAGQTIDDHLAAVHSTGQVEYGSTDAINSTVASTDQNGRALSSFFYEPFGQATSSGTYPFQFTNRIPLTSQFVYYRARYYDSSAGRFISEDPVGPLGADANLYLYTHNNPISFNDPTGLYDFGKASPNTTNSRPTNPALDPLTGLPCGPLDLCNDLNPQNSPPINNSPFTNPGINPLTGLPCGPLDLCDGSSPNGGPAPVYKLPKDNPNDIQPLCDVIGNAGCSIVNWYLSSPCKPTFSPLGGQCSCKF